MTDLLQRHCEACESGTAPLTEEAFRPLLAEVPDWSLGEDKKHLYRTFKFKNYYETIAFVNALAWVAHREDHHPDLEVGYNRCHVIYSTHAVGGLSHNDFICAAKVNALVSEPRGE